MGLDISKHGGSAYVLTEADPSAVETEMVSGANVQV